MAHKSLTFSAVAKELRFKLATELKHYGLVQHNATTIVTQSHRELKEALANYHVATEVYEFEPSGKWAFLNLNRFKFKWLAKPLQTTVGSKVCSILKAKVLTNPINDDKLYVIDMNDPDLMCYFYNGPNRGQSINHIKKTFVGSTSTLSVANVLVQHRSVIKTENVLFPEDILFGDHKLEQVNGIDHAVITLDRHGIYVNKPSRNKIDPIDPTLLSRDFPVIDGSFTLWIESDMAGDYLLRL